MKWDEIESVAGLAPAEDGEDRPVWDMLERYPDKYDRKTGRVIVEGEAKATLGNVRTVLMHDPRWAGRIRYNELTTQKELDGEPIQDVDEIDASIWMADAYGFNAASTRLAEAFIHVAAQNKYHPIQEYLQSLVWDGVDRIDGWLTDYMGAEETPLIKEIGKRFLMSAVARAMEPGCKCDTVMILAGKQGARKSSGLEALFGERYFSDCPPDLRNPKDAAAQLGGLWCLEWAELDSMRRREATTIKSWISTRVDQFRPAYGRNVVRRKRQCVITGTTNELQFLRDSTGERRFWPVLVTDVDVEAIREDRDQLWAEALMWYRTDRRWWLSPEMDEELRQYGERFSLSDTWAQELANWVAHPHQAGGFTLKQACEDALGIESPGQNRAVLQRVTGVLHALGFEERTRSRQKIWRSVK